MSVYASPSSPSADSRMADVRVPAIVALYWVIKIAATTLGETGADMFSMTLDLGYSATIGLFMALFAVLVVVKLSRPGYEPTLYWLTFTASAIAGTAISDFIDRTLGLGYAWGSLLLVSLLLLVLWRWQRAEGSVDVEHIATRRGEVWYWLAFLLANTLGTAAGDYLADDLALGFAAGALVICGLLLTILGVYWRRLLPGTLLFWLAFVLTRPFGATFGDWLTKPLTSGGLDLGTTTSSLFFAVILVVAVLLEHRQVQLARGS
jgi:uncharacterized membrane-anchored protein